MANVTTFCNFTSSYPISIFNSRISGVCYGYAVMLNKLAARDASSVWKSIELKFYCTFLANDDSKRLEKAEVQIRKANTERMASHQWYKLAEELNESYRRYRILKSS